MHLHQIRAEILDNQHQWFKQRKSIQRNRANDPLQQKRKEKAKVAYNIEPAKSQKKNTKHNQLSSQNSQQWSQADMLFKGRVPQNAVTTACTREVYAIELSYPFAALVCEDDS